MKKYMHSMQQPQPSDASSNDGNYPFRDIRYLEIKVYKYQKL